MDFQLPMSGLSEDAQSALRTLFSRLPLSSPPRLASLTAEALSSYSCCTMDLDLPDLSKRFLCLEARTLFPKTAKTLAAHVHWWKSKSGETSYEAIVLAPFVSPESARILTDEGMGYIDFAGNTCLHFYPIWIEREVPGNPFRVQRQVRPLFRRQAARIMLTLLLNPGPWKGLDLGRLCGVSMGYISEVKKALDAHGWLDPGKRLHLIKPSELLHTWAEQYPPAQASTQYYSALHGEKLGQALEQLRRAKPAINLLLTGASAAAYYAPHLRQPNLSLLGAPDSEADIKEALQLGPVTRGGNIFMEVADLADMRFQHKKEIRQGIWLTDPVSTYLALSCLGERGREAASVLEAQVLSKLWDAD